MRRISIVLSIMLMAGAAGAQCAGKDATDLNDEGLAHWSKGQGDLAIDCLQKAVKVSPRPAVALFNLGVVSFHLGDTLDAIAYFKRSLAIDAKMAKTYTSLGAAYFKVGDNDKAIEALRTAVKLDPSDAFAQSNLSRGLIRVGRLGEAETVFRRASELGPDSWEVRKTRAYLAVARHRYREAIDDLLVVIGVVPGDEGANLLLAGSYKLGHHRDLAIGRYQLFKTSKPELAAKIYDIIYGDSVIRYEF